MISSFKTFFFPFQLMILGNLPVQSIINVSCTCRELRSLSSDSTLWQHLVLRDFGKMQLEIKIGCLCPPSFKEGHRNKGSDLQLKKLLIFKQILLVSALGNLQTTTGRICIPIMGCK